MAQVPGTSPDDAEDGQPHLSDEDARTFVEQLRSTPAEQILAEVFSTLLTAAEVKLGRRDARLFIDLCAAMSQCAGGYLSDDLGKQVDEVLGQLRLGQVSAENKTVGNGKSEPNDLSRRPTSRVTDVGTEASTGVPPTPAPPSKLWVPGR